MDTKRDEEKISNPFEAVVYKLQPKAGDILVLKSEWADEACILDFKKALAKMPDGGQVMVVGIDSDDDLYVMDAEQRQKLLTHLTSVITPE
jgi:hypothetical protein